MIFWILVTIVALLAIAWLIADGFPPFFGTLIIGGAAGGFIWVLCMLIPTEHDTVREDTYQLKSIGNSSSTGGSLFLGSGYVEDKRVLNFITQRDSGAIRVERSEAEHSTIYEGAEKATVKVSHIDHINGWVSPWPIGSHDEYEFRIPSGSVVESYTLDNK